ncbi:MAG: hypothetical protein WEA31_03555 [Pirellulales bacterium]
MFRCIITAGPWIFLAATTLSAHAADETHLLRYKFTPGEAIRTKVVHQATVKTTIDGTSQTANTVSVSVKNWNVEDVTDGVATFVHSVDYVDMWNQISGREKISYDSRQDADPPAGFETVAQEVAIPLTRFKVDGQGTIVHREKLRTTPAPEAGHVMIPLPEEPIAIGGTWDFPYDVPVTLRGGEKKIIKARQRFTLESVKDDVAAIKIETQILTPVNNPEIQAQLVQRESTGTAQFDVKLGKMIRQQVDLDRRVIGYPNEASSMHYRTRFTEELLRDDLKTAAQPDGKLEKK